MASNSVLLFQLPLIIILLTLSNTFLPSISCFTAIFSFGDSLADTGNVLHCPGEEDFPAAQLPYGQTYFHHPTGRCSDGRLVIDFIAQEMGLPLLPPYLAGPSGQDFRRGSNFAVGGATALDNHFFRERGIDVGPTIYSLGLQIEWFKGLLPSLCYADSECEELLSNSLFMMGEIGGNDYNYAFFEHRTLDEIQTYVPHVINATSSAINVLIELGARILVVPGNYPIGCVSCFLAMYQSPRIEDYDPQTGCLNWLNEFSEYHNRQLQDELDRLRRQHPRVTIVYADNYEAGMRIFRSPSQFGFNKVPLAACCGGDGPYNVNSSVQCGDRNSKVCSDPSRYICWDGLHLTEAAYKAIADGLLKGPYAIPSISKMCSYKADHRSDITIADALLKGPYAIPSISTMCSYKADHRSDITSMLSNGTGMAKPLQDA